MRFLSLSLSSILEQYLYTKILVSTILLDRLRIDTTDNALVDLVQFLFTIYVI